MSTTTTQSKSKGKHNYFSVTSALREKQDIIIKDKTVYVRKDHATVGNKSWGKIDYLKKIFHYDVMFLNDMNFRDLKHDKVKKSINVSDLLSTAW